MADKAKAASAVSVLKEYHTKLSGQASEMETKVQQLESQISAAYGIPEFKKSPYHLHSICVHDGNAMSGHYYTFIFDRFNNKWRRFNDIRVTEVPEEEVFKESEGGHSWQTAYWLVYVQDSIAKELDTSDINFYEVPADPYKLQDFSKHAYGKCVPQDVNLIVEKENCGLQKEIDDQRNQKSIG